MVIESSPRPIQLRDGEPADVAASVGVADILVFAREGGRFRLVGGVGRGTGWAEIVEIDSRDEPLVDRAWRSGVPVTTASERATHVIGPYWARHSVVVPVGDEHLVVFGNPTAIDVSDATLVSAAAKMVSGTHPVPAEKLLADELELVHAVRALTAYRAESVRETARHIATVAARALSCDVAAIQVQDGELLAIEMVRMTDGGGAVPAEDLAGPDAAAFLEEAGTMTEPRVEQVVDPDPRVWTDDVVSRMTLPIGGSEVLGALSLGHAASRPRGFTMLCRRIGRALADAAELLLSQAMARERLADEHALLRRVSLTDALTGVGNRAAWDAAIGQLAAAADRVTGSFAIISADLDELKEVNDRHGHAVGDAVLRGAASLLQASVRDGDTVARVGGDEFMLLLLETDEREARSVARRIARNLRYWRVTEHDLAPELSVGFAVGESDAPAVACRADERMYAAKRRRARSRAMRAAGSPHPAGRPARRPARRLKRRSGDA